MSNTPSEIHSCPKAWRNLEGGFICHCWFMATCVTCGLDDSNHAHKKCVYGPGQYTPPNPSHYEVVPDSW